MPKSQPVQEDPNSPFVYVDLYIMLGDADDSIEGVAILPRADWEADMELFKQSLGGRRESNEREHHNGYSYFVSPGDWTVKSCTAEEAATLKKFIGEDHSFRWPSDFIEE